MQVFVQCRVRVSLVPNKDHDARHQNHQLRSPKQHETPSPQHQQQHSDGRYSCSNECLPLPHCPIVVRTDAGELAGQPWGGGGAVGYETLKLHLIIRLIEQHATPCQSTQHKHMATAHSHNKQNKHTIANRAVSN